MACIRWQSDLRLCPSVLLHRQCSSACAFSPPQLVVRLGEARRVFARNVAGIRSWFPILFVLRYLLSRTWYRHLSAASAARCDIHGATNRGRPFHQVARQPTPGRVVCSLARPDSRADRAHLPQGQENPVHCFRQCLNDLRSSCFYLMKSRPRSFFSRSRYLSLRRCFRVSLFSSRALSMFSMVS